MLVSTNNINNTHSPLNFFEIQYQNFYLPLTIYSPTLNITKSPFQIEIYLKRCNSSQSPNKTYNSNQLARLSLTGFFTYSCKHKTSTKSPDVPANFLVSSKPKISELSKLFSQKFYNTIIIHILNHNKKTYQHFISKPNINNTTSINFSRIYSLKSSSSISSSTMKNNII